jgi:hypothetical protein
MTNEDINELYDWADYRKKYSPIARTCLSLIAKNKRLKRELAEAKQRIDLLEQLCNKLIRAHEPELLDKLKAI